MTEPKRSWWRLFANLRTIYGRPPPLYGHNVGPVLGARVPVTRNPEVSDETVTRVILRFRVLANLYGPPVRIDSNAPKVRALVRAILEEIA